MTTTTEQEEELLIISDDSDENLDIDLTLEEEKSNDSDIISFGDDSAEKENVEITLDEPEKESVGLELGELSLELDSDNDLNLDFDLGGEDSGMTVEKMLGEKEEHTDTVTKIEEPSDDEFDFGFENSDVEDEKLSIVEDEGEKSEIKIEAESDTFLEDFSLESDDNEGEKEIEVPLNSSNLELGAVSENQAKDSEIAIEELEGVSEMNKDLVHDLDENISEDTSDDTVSKTGKGEGLTGDDDMNTIIDATIAQLDARKETIEAVKKNTISSIAKLNEEIKSLQGEVKVHKVEVKECDKETVKIAENIESLEKMKMS